MVLLMTSKDPDDRPSAKEILSSNLLKEEQHEKMIDHMQAELKRKEKVIQQQAKRLLQQERQINDLMAQLERNKCSRPPPEQEDD